MTDQIQPETKPVKRRGCFFYGCITCLVLFLIVGIGGFIGVRYVLNKAAAFVEQYTDSAPMTLPKAEMSEADYRLLDQRVTAFTDALKAQKPTPPLALTGDEINALIANNLAWKGLKGKVYASIENDQIRGQVSIPMDDLAARLPGFSRLKGRYLNGSASLKVALVNGVLVVTLHSLEVKGQSPSAQYMTQLQGINLAQNTSQDKKTSEMIAKLESIEVKDGKLTIKAKSKE